MITNKVAFKYAQGLFELAYEEDMVDSILAQLKEITEMIVANDDLSNALHHPQLGKKKKKKIVDELFSNQITTELLNFLKLLIDKKRVEQVINIYRELEQLVAIERGEASLKVEVQSPIELDKKRKKKLSNKLESLLDKKIDMEIEIKPELLGGLVVKVGDKVIDGSMLRKLKSLEEDIKSLEVSKLGVKWNES